MHDDQRDLEGPSVTPDDDVDGLAATPAALDWPTLIEWHATGQVALLNWRAKPVPLMVVGDQLVPVPPGRRRGRPETKTAQERYAARWANPYRLAFKNASIAHAGSRLANPTYRQALLDVLAADLPARKRVVAVERLLIKRRIRLQIKRGIDAPTLPDRKTIRRHLNKLSRGR